VDFKALENSLKRLADPKAAGDLNAFLEKLPQTAGQTVLIAAGIAWMAGAGLGLFAAVQIQSMTKLRAELQDISALKPPVPVLADIPVPQKEVEEFGKSLAKTYPNVEIKQQGPNIQITAKSTALFGVWREAVGHVQNGGSGWRVSVDKMCVGRECKSGGELGVLLKINKVSVDKPQI